MRERLVADGFELDPGEDATFVREMNDAGKSSVRVNGRIATASYVREIGTQVAEIVGQHDAQRLLLPAYQSNCSIASPGLRQSRRATSLLPRAFGYARARRISARSVEMNAAPGALR